MRISTVQAFNNGISGLQSNYGSVTRTQEEISTGKKILTPADDPVASVKLLQISQEEALNAQYKTGMTAAKNSLQSQDVIFSTLTESILPRIREIAVQSGNGALSTVDRKALAEEIKQREDEVFNLLNSKDANGMYLFSGSQGSVQPFQRNSDGTYSYNGDDTKRSVQIASSTFLPISSSGSEVFEGVDKSNGVTTQQSTLLGTEARISQGLIFDRASYNEKFKIGQNDSFDIKFSDSNSYEIYDSNNNLVVKGDVSGESSSTKVINFAGVELRIDGEIKSGDSFKLKANKENEKTSLLNIIQGMREGLEKGGSSYDVRDNTAASLNNLDNVSAQILSAQGKIGAGLNTVDSTSVFIEDVSLVNKAVTSDLQDLDYAEALSRIALQSTLLEATQKSFAKLSGLSLFSYL